MKGLDRNSKEPYTKNSLKSGFGRYPQSLQEEALGIFFGKRIIIIRGASDRSSSLGRWARLETGGLWQSRAKGNSLNGKKSLSVCEKRKRRWTDGRERQTKKKRRKRPKKSIRWRPPSSPSRALRTMSGENALPAFDFKVFQE
jgi:hypothetical protein